MTAPTNDKPDGQDHTATLLLTLADTTWRMLIPTALLAAVGVFMDLKFGTKPWITLASIPVGLMASAGLIRRQLRRVA